MSAKLMQTVPVDYTEKNTSTYTDTCCSKTMYVHMYVHPAVFVVLRNLYFSWHENFRFISTDSD